MHRSSSETAGEEKDDLLNKLEHGAIPTNNIRKPSVGWQLATVILAFLLLVETVFVLGLVYSPATNASYQVGFVNEFGRLT